MRTRTKKLTQALARKNSAKSFGGFTIIEVLIVLAIAGLILAIVFLAVPALQRNSRNNAIRSDAANVLAGVNEYVANNNGQLPTNVGPTATNGDVPISGGGGTQQTTAKIRAGTITADSCTMPGDTGSIAVCFNRKCTNNDFATAPSGRAFAAGFRVESGSSNSTQCLES